MNKTFIAIASVCIVIAITSPIVSYVYFCDRFNAAAESYELQISDLEQQNENLRQENEKLNETPAYLTRPYLVTELGWYLHESSDPVTDSRNKFTIYGTVYNVGAATAYNCTLIVKFCNGMRILQTSEISIGTINCWFQKHVSTVIACKVADSVTRIEVERFWSTYKP
jgi:hypothetical protein